MVPPTRHTSRSTAVHVPPTAARHLQEDLVDEVTEGYEEDMGRLVPTSTRKRRSLLVQQEQSQNQLLTPTSTTTTATGRLQRAYSASLKTPAVDTPAPTKALPQQKIPALKQTYDDNWDTVDLTGSDDFTSSDSNPFAFEDNGQIWTEDHASRPEPAKDVRGNKRKSDEISRILDHGADLLDDEFPDIDDFVGNTSTESIIHATPKTSRQQIVLKPEVVHCNVANEAAGSQAASQVTIRGSQLKKDSSEEPRSVKRLAANSTYGLAISEVPSGFVTQTPRTVKRGSPMKVEYDDISLQRGQHLPRKTRRDSQVIQDSDEEWATPPTHNVSMATVHSTSPNSPSRASQEETSCDRTRKRSPVIIAFDTPSRKHHETDPISRSPPLNHSSQPKIPIDELSDGYKKNADVRVTVSSQTGPLPVDDVQTAILRLFLSRPSILQKHRAIVEEKLKQNRDDFRAALMSGQIRQTDVLKRDKERLTRQHAALNALSDEHQTYEDSVLEKDLLVEKIMEVFEHMGNTVDLDGRMDELRAEIASQESSMKSSLLKAGINDVAMFEDREPARGNRPNSVVQATQQARHQPQARSLREPISTDGSGTEVIMQTQPPRRSEISGGLDYQVDDEPLHSRLVGRERPRAMSPAPRATVSRSYAEPSFARTMSAPSMDEDLYDMDDEDELFDQTPSYGVSLPRYQPAEATASLRSRRTPAKMPAKRNETFMSEDDFDDDVDMLEFAQDFETKQSSSETASRRADRSVFAEMSANPTATKQKPVKRVTSTSARPSFPPELMKFSWSPEVRRALKDRFRMSGFRHNQLEAINTTLAGKDAFVLMPTGGGKSLCYQLPAVIKSGKTHGVTIVVSPLISLMQDQVDHLSNLNIQARSFNGEMNAEYRKKTLDALKVSTADQFLDLLYVTPEMINKSGAFRSALQALYRNRKLARLVIDEAHCVSQWGHDFRPDYKELGGFRREFPNIPVMALTATATPNVIVDIKHNLGIDKCQVFSQSFNRPNLYYEVRRKEKGTIDLIGELITSKYQGQTGIVYTLSRKNAESTAKKLQEHGIAAHHYHAGIESVQKSQIQKDWQKGKIKVVVATIAFGMGIDKPDVRFVIHQTLPKSLEGYYQETGRAGRDGQASECYLFFNYGDVTQLRKMIADGDGNEEQKERQRRMLNTVTAFAESQSDCRRVEILRYFGESFEKADCHSTCDNCKANGTFEKRDCSDLAKAVLEMVKSQKKLTLAQCTDILLGSQKKKMHETMNAGTLEHFGFAKKMPKHEIHRVIDRLAAEEALREDNVFNKQVKMAFQYFFVSKARHPLILSISLTSQQLGPNASAFLRGHQKLMLTVQVKGGDSQAKASSSKTKAPGVNKQTKLTTAMLPPSTNISSPMTKSKKQKGKGKAAVVYDDDSEEEHYEMHDDGYAKDDFVVDNDSFDDDFEEMPISRNSRQKRTVGPPIAQDADLESLDKIHQDMINVFEEESVAIAADIQNRYNMRKPVFTWQHFRTMITKWTLTLGEIASIPGVDQTKVKQYGPVFLERLREYHQEYVQAFQARSGNVSAKPTPRRVSAHSVVDLVSESDEEMEDGGEDEDDDGEDSHYFAAGGGGGGGGGGGSQRTLPPEVQRWNAEMDELQNRAPGGSSHGQSTSTAPRGGAGRFAKGGRRGYRKASGGSRAGAGVRKKASSKRTSTGSSRSAPSAFGTSGRGGRGASRTAAGGRQTTLEMAGRIDMMPH